MFLCYPHCIILVTQVEVIFASIQANESYCFLVGTLMASEQFSQELLNLDSRPSIMSRVS